MSRKSLKSKQRTPNSPTVLPAEDAALEQQQRTQQIIVSGRATSGPLPSSDEMERYASILPDYPPAILEMAQKSQEHYIAMDREQIRLQERHLDLAEKEAEWRKAFVRDHHRLFGRGQFFGFAFGLMGLAVAAFMAHQGDSPAGAATVGAVVAVLGGAFAFGKWTEKKAEEFKAQQVSRKKESP